MLIMTECMTFFEQFDKEASFKAYFSVESPPEFTVTPTEGILEAYGTEGTNFIVSFMPKGEHSAESCTSTELSSDFRSWNTVC